MQVRFMSTDGGPHPADKWAEITVAYILDLIEVDDNSATPAAMQARRERRDLRGKIQSILEGHHGTVQESERGKLSTEGHDRLKGTIDPAEHPLDKMTDDIVSAAEGMSIIGPHFQKPEVRTAIRGLIGNHFATSMDIERSWHADRNQDHPVARAYRAARAAHGAEVVHSHIENYLPGGAHAHLAANGPPPAKVTAA
jgi:hypothetical protein